MSTLGAFLLRDFRVAWSYRLGFFFQNVGMVFSLLSLRFMAELFNERRPESLAAYGGDYFAFALLGVALSLLSYPAVKAFAGGVRAAQVTGTFEAELTTRAHPWLIVIGSGLYAILASLVQLVFFIALAGALFGAQYELANLGLVVIVLALTLASLTGIGLMSAAFLIVFKQGEPLTGGLMALSAMVGGVLYPVSVLPGWLRAVAPLVPLTHAAELSRGLFLAGANTGSMAGHAAALAGFSLLLPAGIVLLSYAIGRARRTGSLAQY